MTPTTASSDRKIVQFQAKVSGLLFTTILFLLSKFNTAYITSKIFDLRSGPPRMNPIYSTNSRKASTFSQPATNLPVFRNPLGAIMCHTNMHFCLSCGADMGEEPVFCTRALPPAYFVRGIPPETFSRWAMQLVRARNASSTTAI